MQGSTGGQKGQNVSPHLCGESLVLLFHSFQLLHYACHLCRYKSGQILPTPENLLRFSIWGEFSLHASSCRHRSQWRSMAYLCLAELADQVLCLCLMLLASDFK